MGGPGRLPTPSPCSADGAVGGGGGGRLARYVLPGDLGQGRGDLWRVNLAGHVRVWIWRISMARHFGGSSWLIYSAGFSKQEKTYVVEQ